MARKVCDECDVDLSTMLCRVCGSYVIGPVSDPQSEFLATDADIAVFGGGAGGGKTHMLALYPAQHVDVRGYAGVIFRRTSPELVGGGSLWEATQSIYRHLGGRSRAQPNLDWRFPSGAMIELRHLQHADDVYSHQGKQYAFVGFDELTHFEESQFWYLVSRLRSTCGVRPVMRATCNPDPDSFVRSLVDWWIDPNSGLAIPERSGVLRWFVRREDDSLDWGDSREEVEARNPRRRALSFTFIPARLADNPVLLVNDPGYEDRLASMSRVERARLLGGDWNARATAGDMFGRAMFPILDYPVEEHRVKRRVRAWDKAASRPTQEYPDPDWTRGARIAELHDGGFVIEHVASIRGTPGEVEALMVETAARDGRGVEIAVWQDPGAAGVADADRTVAILRGFRVHTIRASRDKVAFASTWQSRAERRGISLVRGPWVEPFLVEVEAFPSDRAHDDQIDAVSLAFQVIDDSAPVARPLRIRGL